MAESEHIMEKPQDTARPAAQSASSSEPEKQTTPGEESAPSQEKGGDKQQQDKKKEEGKDDGKSKKDEQPAGGYDSTPLPKAPPGWTVKITFVKATNLPIADINSLSSDPYVLAQINTGLATRHKEDPPLRFRTQTVRRETEPVWNAEWIVANVPSSGFKLKARVYDEDPADHDDRLGNVHVLVDRIDENYKGFKEKAYGIRKRMGSKRAYLIRAFTTCIRVTHHMHGELYVSVEVLGRSQDENGGRAYTIGPATWTKHYSPMLGRITGLKEDKGGNDEKKKGSEGAKDGDKSKNGEPQRYNFQANQMQLPGPVPAALYHRYVEFKPFVKGMFTNKGLRGLILNKALHHQHARVYNYDRSTLWGIIPTDDPLATSRRFLELVHYDRGGRIFTYVLTLDAQFRFTETGKEFGIDMLSKHTMHSDVSVYIAFSGEFFIRRHTKGSESANHEPPSDQPTSSSALPNPVKPLVHENRDTKTDPSSQEGGQVMPENPINPVTKEGSASLDPSDYELIIDNDSGTYRPNAALLPLLRTFMQRSFPGLHVRVLDCQKDEERMGKLKDEQRERKKAEAGGKTVVYTQRDRSDSFSSQSSSDEEDLDAAGAGAERGLGKQVLQDAQWRAGARVRHWKDVGGGKRSEGEVEDAEGSAEGAERKVEEEPDTKGLSEVGKPTSGEKEVTPKVDGHRDGEDVQGEERDQGQAVGDQRRYAGEQMHGADSADKTGAGAGTTHKGEVKQSS